MAKLVIVLKMPIKKKADKKSLQKFYEMRETLESKLSETQARQLIHLAVSKKNCMIEIDSKLIKHISDAIDSLERSAEFYVNSAKCESLHDAYGKLMK